MSETALPYAYCAGKLVPYSSLTVHSESMAMRYALSAFEGLRAYVQHDGVTLRYFALSEHIERLSHTLHLLALPSVSETEINSAATLLLKANKPSFDCYLRLAVNATNHGALKDPVTMTLYGSLHRMGRKRWLESGDALSLLIGTQRKPTDDMLPQRAKVIANYTGPRIGTVNALACGFDDILLLSSEGNIAEAPTANVVFLMDDKVVTPQITDGILPGITLRHVLEICDGLGYSVEERSVTVSEALNAREAFLCGTGLELAPIGRFNDRSLPKDRHLFPLVVNAYFAKARGAPREATCY